MSALGDLYQILEVDRSADKKAIEKAFRKIAMKCHPDRVNNKLSRGQIDEAEAETLRKRYNDANTANAILADDSKRAAYDAGGMAAVERLGSGGAGSGPRNGPKVNVSADGLAEYFGANDDVDDFAADMLKRKKKSSARRKENEKKGTSIRDRFSKARITDEPPTEKHTTTTKSSGSIFDRIRGTSEDTRETIQEARGAVLADGMVAVDEDTLDRTIGTLKTLQDELGELIEELTEQKSAPASTPSSSRPGKKRRRSSGYKADF